MSAYYSMYTDTDPSLLSIGLHLCTKQYVIELGMLAEIFTKTNISDDLRGTL